MKLYLVRHGQTVFNAEGRHQYPDTPLSKKGLRQAELLAKRFSSLPVDIIISSSYKRAFQTAKQIQAIAATPLITTGLLIERKNPTVYQGKLKDDPEIISIKQAINEKERDFTWRHSDEENYADQLQRVKKVFEMIEKREEEYIVAVTHGYFLSFLICYILFGEQITPQLFRDFRHATRYSNTGLTICSYEEKKWKLLTWNDYAHLGE